MTNSEGVGENQVDEESKESGNILEETEAGDGENNIVDNSEDPQSDDDNISVAPAEHGEMESVGKVCKYLSLTYTLIELSYIFNYDSQMNIHIFSFLITDRNC